MSSGSLGFCGTFVSCGIGGLVPERRLDGQEFAEAGTPSRSGFPGGISGTGS